MGPFRLIDVKCYAQRSAVAKAFEPIKTENKE